MAKRLVIMGNSGSGKTWLSQALGEKQTYAMDALVWQPGYYEKKRPKNEIESAIKDLIQGKNWIIEGVFGWMVERCLARATHLVWLDVPVEECLENLSQRGPQFEDVLTDLLQRQQALSALMVWASTYHTRGGSTSRPYHEALFKTFIGQKNRLDSRQQMLLFHRMWKG